MFLFVFCHFDMNLVFKYLLIIFINLFCYFRSLPGDYVFDDSVAILKNKDVYDGFKNDTIKVGFHPVLSMKIMKKIIHSAFTVFNQNIPFFFVEHFAP